MTDGELLARFVREKSDEAFSEVVERHKVMVFSACARRLGDDALAHDAAQAVFFALARKAKGLTGAATLAPWLYRAARFAAAEIRRAEEARARREKEAAEMKMQAQQAGVEASWGEVRPLLDAAIDSLPAKSRDAIVLHYLEGKEPAAMARELGCAENAVRLRISHGLKKLREKLRGKGLVISVAALGGLLAGRTSEAMAAGFALSASGSAMAAGGTVVPANVSFIAKGAMKMMFWAKVKAVAAICAVTVAVGGVGSYGVAKLALAADAGAPGDEKLLLGFEKAEMEKIADACWKGNNAAKPPFVKPVDPQMKRYYSAPYIADWKDAYECHFGGYWGRWYGYVMYLIRKGQATEGEFALAWDYKAANENTLRCVSGSWKDVFQKNYPGMYEQYAKASPELGKYMDYVLEWTEKRCMMGEGVPAWGRSLLYTLGWFDKCFPADWSGYDVLLLDVMSTGVDVADFRVGVEDECVEPFVERSYEIPAGKWVTLKFDLRAAAKEKHLDLAHMVNIQIYPWSFKGKENRSTTLLFDNVRLAKEGKGKMQTTALDGKFAGPPEPPVLKIEKPALQGAKPDMSPLKDEKPISVDISAIKKDIQNAQGRSGSENIGSRGIISAYDNNRMLLVFGVNGGEMFAFGTLDGGKTWKGIDNADKPTYLHRSILPGEPYGGAAAENGGFTYVGYRDDIFAGCSQDWPSPRFFSTTVSFDGKEWKLKPFGFLTDDPRHCYVRTSAVTLESGRMWMAMAMPNRHKSADVFAKYSDDGGLTWRSWRGNGLSGRIDGSDPVHTGTSGGDHYMHLAPYGEHVACFWQQARSWATMCSFYDGKAWSAPQKAGDGLMLSAATLGKKDLFLSSSTGVFKYNGTAWVKEQSALGTGFLAAAGKDKLILFGAPTVWDKAPVWPADKISCQARGKDGAWSAPKALADEPGFKRNWSNFGVPMYSPPNFVPISWVPPNQKSVIKVLRAPVD